MLDYFPSDEGRGLIIQMIQLRRYLLLGRSTCGVTSFPTFLAAIELRLSSKEAGSISGKVPEKTKIGILRRAFIMLRFSPHVLNHLLFPFFGKWGLFGKKIQGAVPSQFD